MRAPTTNERATGTELRNTWDLLGRVVAQPRNCTLAWIGNHPNHFGPVPVAATEPSARRGAFR